MNMAYVRYIDPELGERLNSVSPLVRKECGYEFDIAARIHEVLKRKRWSQADLARATGKKEATVSLWMSGTHNFTIRTISEIELALGEPIISIRRYRKNNGVVDGYSRPDYTLLLNDGDRR